MQVLVPLHNRPKPAPWYKHRWPWLLMMGPMIVVLAGIHTTWLAFSRQDALVVGDYYKEGKAINQDLRRDRAAEALRLELDLRYDPATGRLAGRIGSHGGAYQTNLIVMLNHSTLPEKDIRLQVRSDNDGAFDIAVPMLDKARWQVTVEDSQREWRLAGRWLWPQQPAIRVVADTPVLPD